MTIGVSGRGLGNRAGIGRYTRELIRALLELGPEHRFRIFVGPSAAEEHRELLGDSAVVLPGREARPYQEQWTLPRMLASEKLDLFHNPDFILPVLAPKGLPSIVTVHDIAFARLKGSNSLNSKILHGGFVPSSMRRSQAIVSVSEFTKREIVEVYRVPAEKIHVIPNGIEERLAPPSAGSVTALREKLGLPDERVVLYLGGIEPRKNLVKLAEAVKTLPETTLAIAGGKNRGADEIVGRATEILGPRLRMLGFVADEDLPALYGAATVFAYPSIYEGFGIPPVEAMACGAPVACSKLTSLPEAVGPAAELFDPHDVRDIAAKIGRLLDSDSLRQIRVDTGFTQAARFRWPDIAKRTLDLYERVAQA